MSRRKAPKNPLFEHYSDMAAVYRARTKEHFNSARDNRGYSPANERTSLNNAAITEEKALRYAQLAEKERPVENTD